MEAGHCEQLLSDIRAVAVAPAGRTHFIGSILATTEDAGTVTLVDGQQRVTTLMLILAAIRSYALAGDGALAGQVVQDRISAFGLDDEFRVKLLDRADLAEPVED